MAYVGLALSLLILLSNSIHFITTLSQLSKDLAIIDNAVLSKPVLQNFSQIADAHLFGENIANQLNEKQLPKSALNLKIVGIMLAIPAVNSQVIVRLPDGHEKIFTLGEILPGDAKIIKIMQGSIIIKHNNKKELLFLPQNKLDFDHSPKVLEFEHE